MQTTNEHHESLQNELPEKGGKAFYSNLNPNSYDALEINKDIHKTKPLDTLSKDDIVLIMLYRN